MFDIGVVSKGNLAIGLLGAGLAAASLGMAGTASASCVNISGFAIGRGCRGPLPGQFRQHRDSDRPHARR